MKKFLRIMPLALSLLLAACSGQADISPTETRPVIHDMPAPVAAATPTSTPPSYIS